MEKGASEEAIIWGGGRFKSVGARIGQKLSIAQRAHYACRAAYFRHGNLDKVRQPVGVDGKKWRREVRKYKIPPGAPYTVRLVNADIGLGIFAVAPLKPNCNLGIESVRGMNVPSTAAGMSLAATYSEVKPKQPISKYVYPEDTKPKWVQYQLHGLLSFANHACPTHSNCTSTRDGKHWQALRTKNRAIKAGDELTIDYGSDEEWEGKCRICNPPPDNEESY